MRLTLFIFALMYFCWCVNSAHSESSNSPRLVCYVNIESFKRGGEGAFNVDKINPHLCTHVIYAFNPSIVTSSSDESSFYNRLLSPKLANPKLKIMSSIQAEDLLPVNSFEPMTDKVVRLTNQVTKYKLDGLEVYSNVSGDGKLNAFPRVEFFTEMRNAFSKHGLLLSIAIRTEEQVTDFMKINHLVDFVSLLAYDLWSSAEHPNWADHPAPLKNTAHNVNVISMIRYWLEHEMPASKINVGIPVYGNSWTIESPFKMDLPISANSGPTNKYTGIAGQMPFYDICSNIRDGGWQKFGNMRNNSVAVYAVSPVNNISSTRTWVGYDDVDTVRMKGEYVRKNGLGGAAVWDLSQDDFLNKCGSGPLPTHDNHFTNFGHPIVIFFAPLRHSFNGHNSIAFLV